MNNTRTRETVMEVLDTEVAKLIASNRGISDMDGLRLFLDSKTHEMLANDDMKLWYFSPLAIFDIWENEVKTGDPGNSLYLRGDEIGQRI